MPGNKTKVFIQALQQAERSRDAEPLVKLFADGAALENPAKSVTRTGPDGARQFWSDYLSAFEQIQSEFTHVLEGDGSATLEWRSEGRLANTGQPVSYHGTSILEFDGDGGGIRRFATYYDSAAFLPAGSKHAGGAESSAAQADAIPSPS